RSEAEIPRQRKGGRELGAGGWELGARSSEQNEVKRRFRVSGKGAGSWEPGAGGRGPGAEDIKHLKTKRYEGKDQ
ncbi:MAG: hypothetical protein JXN62_04925, partial [Bacteroidales bacterium]|nr:hypothetical protein [Bacteroidales bacterium]